MAAIPTGSPPLAAHDEPMFHNPVLTRTKEPARVMGGPWLVVIPLAVVILAGGVFAAFVATHPAPPLVNHAVAALPTSG
jgi:hypothetical protein